MNKKLAVVVAGVMLASCMTAFVGCGTEYTSNINWDVDLSNPIELRGLFPETGMGAFGRDDSAKIIEEKTGYKMNYQEMGANADNDVQKFLSTVEPFHIMKLTEAQYHPYLEDGTFLDLTEILENTPQGRTLYQLIDLMEYGWDSVKYTDSEGKQHIYAIPDFGFVCMTDSALLWNLDHLNQIGFKNKYGVDIPETLSQVTWALETLQAKFNPDGKGSYHALGIPGSNSCEVTPLKGAFDMPFRFYVDENGKIQQYVFSENTTKYVQYMNKLRRGNILSEAWQNETQAGANQKFASELNSCTFISYWNVTPLINAVVSQGNIAASMGIPATNNNYEYMRDNAVKWGLRIKGDGTDGSRVQEEALLEGDPGGVSYYTVIPFYMAEDALYVIDYLTKKIEAFADFYAGTEGTHWNKVVPGSEEFPDATAPLAEDYTEEKDAEYSKHENLPEKIIFIRPYEYTYTKYSNKDPEAGNRLDEDPANVKEEKVTVSGGGFWAKLTKRYIEQIADNSQYCTGTNAVSAKSLFHFRETGFDAWQVSEPDGKGRIPDPMYMCPPMKMWAPISILSRTLLKNGIASAIDAVDSDPVESLNATRQGAREKSVKKPDGIRYYYWSDAISEEMTKWYTEVKVNRK